MNSKTVLVQIRELIFQPVTVVVVDQKLAVYRPATGDFFRKGLQRVNDITIKAQDRVYHPANFGRRRN